jgi:hypothetical protein
MRRFGAARLAYLFGLRSSAGGSPLSP